MLNEEFLLTTEELGGALMYWRECEATKEETMLPYREEQIAFLKWCLTDEAKNHLEAETIQEAARILKEEVEN